MESKHFSVGLSLFLHVLTGLCFLALYLRGNPDLRFFSFVGVLCQAVLIAHDAWLIIRKRQGAEEEENRKE